MEITVWTQINSPYWGPNRSIQLSKLNHAIVYRIRAYGSDEKPLELSHSLKPDSLRISTLASRD